MESEKLSISDAKHDIDMKDLELMEQRVSELERYLGIDD